MLNAKNSEKIRQNSLERYLHPKSTTDRRHHLLVTSSGTDSLSGDSPETLLIEPTPITLFRPLFCQRKFRNSVSLSQSLRSRLIRRVGPVGLVGGRQCERRFLVHLMRQTEIDEPMFIIVIGTGDLIILVVMVGKRRNALMAPILAAERPATVLFVRK